MRGELERKQAETEKLGETGLERVRILEGNAEEIPVGDGWADGVVTAQVSFFFDIFFLGGSFSSFSVGCLFIEEGE